MENFCYTSTDLFYPSNFNKPTNELWFWAVDKSFSVPSLIYLGFQNGHILLFALEQQIESSHRSFELDLHISCAGTIEPLCINETCFILLHNKV